METSSLKNKALSGVVWKLLERCGTQGIAFIVTLVIARFLMPEDYGAIAIINVFIALADVFVHCGLGTALIQNKDVDDDDFSSVFLFNLFMSVILYAIIYFAAPYISEFYKNAELTKFLRILAIKLIPGALNAIQIAIVTKSMKFKNLFYVTVGANIPSGIIGIVMAYFGFGAWALVAQQLSSVIFTSISFFFILKWIPKLVFKVKRVKILLSFGWKMLASNLINTLYSDIRTLMIGRMYSASTLGFYNKGQQVPKYVSQSVDGAIQSVSLSTFSKVQQDKELVKSIMRRSIKTSSYIMFPVMFGIAACSESFVSLALTDKWLPCVPYMQIACFSYSIMPIHTANLQAITAMGRSDIFLKLEIIKKIYGLVVLFCTLPFGVYPMAVSVVFVGILSSFVNAFPNKKLLNYKYVEQIKDILPNLIGTLIMYILVLFIGKINLSKYLVLVIQVVSGVIIYLLYSVFTKSESFYYVLITLKSYMKKR